jgi:hypothetical protein
LSGREWGVRLLDIRETTSPIGSSIRNAYIDFGRMTTSLVAVVTDVVRDGQRVVGYGFNSNGRYGQGGLIRERFAPRLLGADPDSLLDDAGTNLDPGGFEFSYFLQQGGGRQDDTVADIAIDALTQDAGRDQPEHLLASADDQRMTSVMPALEPNHALCVIRQPIHNFSFALVTPLRADDYDVARHHYPFMNYFALRPA